jgi:hypothetical protein
LKNFSYDRFWSWFSPSETPLRSSLPPSLPTRIYVPTAPLSNKQKVKTNKGQGPGPGLLHNTERTRWHFGGVFVSFRFVCFDFLFVVCVCMCVCVCVCVCVFSWVIPDFSKVEALYPYAVNKQATGDSSEGCGQPFPQKLLAYSIGWRSLSDWLRNDL